jgi:hypothetical protein
MELYLKNNPTDRLYYFWLLKIYGRLDCVLTCVDISFFIYFSGGFDENEILPI